MTEVGEKLQKKVDEILLPNQKERLEELSIQVRRGQALSDNKVAAKLSLTDDQKEKLKAISGDYQQKFRDLRQGGGPPNFEEMQKLRTEEGDKEMAVLTSEQKEQFTKLQGKKVEIDLFRGFGRGQGGTARRRPAQRQRPARSIVRLRRVCEQIPTRAAGLSPGGS